MEKMPFIADPRYRETDAESTRTQQRLREDVSMTHRAPYPQEQEINLPRHKMNTTQEKSRMKETEALVDVDFKPKPTTNTENYSYDAL